MSRRHLAIVFDLTPDMLFQLTDGTTVTLAELERRVRLARTTGYAPYPSLTDKRVLANISRPRLGALRHENRRVAQMDTRGAARRRQRVSRGAQGAIAA